ncbi:MAG: class I SAM-dependent methyltransferase [Myxococcales bacterium]
MNAPIWSRLLYGFSRALSALDIGQQIVRDELLFAFLPPSQRSGLTFDAYSRSRSYVVGGAYFLHGLWAWEAALLGDPRVPRSGRVLLPAAGGGRELQVLLERGYEVFAFEPVYPLFESARSVGVAAGSRATVVQANYRDLVAKADGKPGPLDGLGGHFDLCLLGWGSLSHLTEPGAALEALRAVRALAPDAPVIVSFLLRIKGTPDVKGGARKLRHGLRRVFKAIGAPEVPVGLRFGTSHGFCYEYSASEFIELSERAGYQVAVVSEHVYPHALLLPIPISGGP